jgi:hypothetical protein
MTQVAMRVTKVQAKRINTTETMRMMAKILDMATDGIRNQR